MTERPHFPEHEDDPRLLSTDYFDPEPQEPTITTHDHVNSYGGSMDETMNCPRSDRVMVMAAVGGWKVELWAPFMEESLTLRDHMERDEAERYADEVRSLLDAWDKVYLAVEMGDHSIESAAVGYSESDAEAKLAEWQAGANGAVLLLDLTGEQETVREVW